jgi:glycosyltransferase involved in cell wall biosynthesis
MNIAKLSIVIPVYNESRTVQLLLDRVRDVILINEIEKEIIIINDCSSDDTEKAVESYIASNPSLNIQYFKHEINKGKGAALHTGIKKATGDYLIIQDADLEYNPQEYNELLKPIISGLADVVYGSRFLGCNMNRNLYFWQSLGNKFLTRLSNICNSQKLTDMETCYKLFNSKLIQQIDLKEKRFGFEPEITSKISRIPNLRLFEVGISFNGRTIQSGKKINWTDGIRAIYCIFKYGLFKR